MSVHVIRICLALVLLTAVLPPVARASEAPSSVPRSALVGQFARVGYGITMIATGAAMLPITTESIIAGHMEPGEAPGYLVTAALLGLGGIPLLATAARPLSDDPLAGPRARVKLAREGVLAYSILGSMFTTIGVIATAVTAARTGDVPVDLRVYDGASLWLLTTAIGLAADGDLARRRLPQEQRRARDLDHLGGPMLAYGIILLTVVTPALRLAFHDDGLPLGPTALPMLTGVVMFSAGLALLFADSAAQRPIPVAGRGARRPSPSLSATPLLDPANRTGGLAIVGRF